MRNNPLKISLVVATKDRPEEVRSLLTCLSTQTKNPDEVILVDSGNISISEKFLQSMKYPVKYIRFRPPSAARQRNAGLDAVSAGIDFVGFLDDNIVLESIALERMLAFWKEASQEIVGTGFNLANHPGLSTPNLKYSYLAQKLGLYSKKAGQVLASGFQTMIGTVDRITDVQWLPTGAAVWRRSIFETNRFDEWFSAYSYLEDLEFSYRAGRFHRLAVVKDARYFHYPASGGRESGYVFGKREVDNRLYFVRKNPELSVRLCIIALNLRMLMSFMMFIKRGEVKYLERILGNLAGFGEDYLKGNLFVSKKRS